MICLAHIQARAQSCDFTASAIDFSNVNLLGGSSVDGTGSLAISCRNSTNASLFLRICININAGTGGSSSATRQMTNSLNQTLDFQLYQNAGRTISWGSADQTQFGSPLPIDIVLPALTTFSPATTYIYARILASQSVAGGGAYASVFSGAQTRLNYKSYTVTPPSCNGMTDNPTQVNFAVQANVDRTCTVAAQDISFGSHGFLTSQLDAQGGLAVTCTQSLPYTISLNGGLSNASSPTQRAMKKGSEAVLYGLYADSSRTQAWGSAVGQTVSGTGNGVQQNLPIYARVEAQATPSPGTYSDTVVVTVTY